MKSRKVPYQGYFNVKTDEVTTRSLLHDCVQGVNGWVEVTQTDM